MKTAEEKIKIKRDFFSLAQLNKKLREKKNVIIINNLFILNTIHCEEISWDRINILDKIHSLFRFLSKIREKTF